MLHRIGPVALVRDAGELRFRADGHDHLGGTRQQGDNALA
jgi:hypothetical protein